MSNSVLSGKLEFIQYHTPGLTVGDYEITATQTVAGSKIQDKNTFKDTKFFSVAGPRFDLPPQDIYGMFPPPGNYGDHSNVLPHIILNRSTLPWERKIQNNADYYPWLALLVFHQSDIEQGRVSEPKIISFSELRKDQSLYPASASENADKAITQVTVIDIQTSLLKVILPDFQDLPYLAHVRQRKELSVDLDKSYLNSLDACEKGSTQAAEDIFKENFATFKEELKQGGIRLFGACSITCRHNEIKNDEIKKEWVITDAENNKQYIARKKEEVLNVFTSDAEVAIVIANRLPQPGGLTTVHLVSLENRFPSSSFEYGGKDSVRFVSLKSWSFSCTSPDRTFKQILLHLNQDTLRLLEPNNDYLNQGYVALNYYLRKGDKTLAWYHSPLRPCKISDRLYSLTKLLDQPEQQGWYFHVDQDRTHYYWGDQKQKTAYSVTPFFSMNLRTSDQLLCIDEKSGLFETTYAAAWQLGRMLALQDQRFSIALVQWKRNHVQWVHQKKQANLDPHLYQNFDNLSDLRFTPVEISTWFDKLNQLQGVPFNYLVPGAQMLPEESIRFFQVDPLWVDCLLDGAFSLGRCTETDQLQDFLHIIAGNRYPIASGLLLRSEVVSGWAGLLVDGYYKLSKDIELTTETQDKTESLADLPKLQQNLNQIGVPLPNQLRIQYAANTETWTLTDLDTNPDYVETIIGDDDHPQLCMMMPDRDRHYNYTIINGDEEYYLKLPLLRMERLANDVLLCLFQGDIHRVDIHLKPETLHFGLKEEKSSFSKDLKNKDGSEAKTNDKNGNETQFLTVKLDQDDWKVSPDSPSLPGTRSLDIKKLVTEIERQLNLTLTSAQFALQMIEGSELVRFTVEEKKAVKS